MPRPPPEGPPVLLGAFSSCVYMIFLLMISPGKWACAGPRHTSRTFSAIDSVKQEVAAARGGTVARVIPSFFGLVGLESTARFVGHPESIVGIVEHLFDVLL